MGKYERGASKLSVPSLDFDYSPAKSCHSKIRVVRFVQPVKLVTLEIFGAKNEATVCPDDDTPPNSVTVQNGEHVIPLQEFHTFCIATYTV